MSALPWLRRLPVMAGMALLVLPWGLAALNAVAAWVTPGRTAIEERKLFGVQPPAPWPALDAAEVWSGAFQRAFTQAFGQSMPLLATAVGLKNQAYFSLLGQSGIPNVVVGKHLQLYERDYITEYCSRDPAALLPAAETWAAQLAQLQRWYAAEGKTFVYVVTPSKAATVPQDLPHGRACRAPPADRDGLIPAWNGALDRHGVRHVDAAGLVRQAPPGYPAMFARGGTHWNDVAAALATQAVVRAVNAAPGPWRLADFDFTWRMASPMGVARDITDLMNLPFPRLDYAVPEVALQPHDPAACRPATVAAVGGSFTFEILSLLMKLPCVGAIDFYAYFQLLHAAYPGDIRHDVDPAQREEALLRQAGIVILEENEQMAMRSAHGPAFYRLAAAQHGVAASR